MKININIYSQFIDMQLKTIFLLLLFLICKNYLAAQELSILGIRKLAQKGAYEDALSVAKQMLKKQDLDESVRWEANLLAGKLYGVYVLGNLDSSLYYLQTATQIAEKMNNDTLKAESYERLGVLYENRSQRTKVLEYYEKSAELYQALEDEEGKAIILSNIAIHYSYQGNYQKSNQYLEQAIPIVNKLKRNKAIYLASTYSSLGSNYWDMGAYEKAFETYKKGIVFRNQAYPLGHNLRTLDLTNLASTFSQLGFRDSAIVYLEQGINQIKDKNSKSLGILYLSYARVCEEQKKYEEAIKWANRGLKIYQSLYNSPRQIRLADGYNLLTKIMMKKGAYKEAVTYAQKALFANSYFFEDSLGNSNPSPEDAIGLDVQLLSLIQKGQSYLAWYQATQETTYLENAWEVLKLAIGLIERVRLKHYHDYPLLMVRQEAQQAYRVALSCLYEKEKLEPKQFTATIFSLFEQSKAYTFLAQTQQQAKIQNPSDLPEVIRSWTGIKERIEFLEGELLAEHRLHKDTEKGKKIEQELFDLRQQQEQELNVIQEELPDYYQQYFNIQYKTLSDVQKTLKEDHAVIEYIVNDDHLLVLKIEAKALSFLKIELKKPLEKQISDFREHILSKQDVNYLAEAHELYQLLLEPVKLSATIKKITFVVDETLHTLAFDALLTKAVPSEEFPNYQTLPYLIKAYQLSYDYSATSLLSYSSNYKQKTPSLLALAPQFTAVNIPNNSINRGDQLAKLSGNKVEVEQISNLFKSTIFTEKKATKTNFLVHAPNAQLVHLATHGLVDNQQPAYSAIAFSGDSTAVDFLYAYELYGKELPIEMMTLSACNSGVGQLKLGEGMMSLGRAFALAGCPSVVMSLWEIADQSAPFIFPEFYRLLAQGYSKDIALQQAKLMYIKQSDANGAHPYYWAGITLMGNTSAVVATTSYSWMIIVGLLFVILVPLIFFIRGGVGQ